MFNVTILEKVFLSDNSKYSYCPYCVQELTNEGKDYKDILKPLMFVKTKELIPRKDGNQDYYFDQHYECTRCGNTNITADIFSMIYGDKKSVYRAKGIPCDDIVKVWDKNSNSFVDAKWNVSKNAYVQITEKLPS